MDMNDEPVIEQHPQGIIITLPDGYVSRLIRTENLAMACIMGLRIANRIDQFWAELLVREIRTMGLPDSDPDEIPLVVIRLSPQSMQRFRLALAARYN
ncbi:hypothetical protein KW796_00230 [Candidatus Parcubacteria bacterium]|nr:hypothetical protein [Candidatus Parcubacteria bacterium]